MNEVENIDMESRILEAAKKVFVLKGYNEATMGDIANEAGIGRTALHYYYRTKEMLFTAIFGQLMGLILPNIKIVVEDEATMFEKIPRIIDQYISVLQENMLFPIFVIMEMNRDPKHLYEAILKDPDKIMPVLQLRRQLEDEMEKGTLKKRNIMDVISTLIGLLVFPVLIRNPLAGIFLDGDMEEYRKYITERGPFIKEIVLNMLTPDNKDHNL